MVIGGCFDFSVPSSPLIAYLIAYLIGSIPFGLLLTKIFTKQDLRTIGSGNIGATNVLRTGKKGLALATLISDGAKGALAILLVFLWDQHHFQAPQDSCLSLYFANSSMLVVGMLAILGHCFPIWLKFKDGKGVATALGVFLAAVPYAGIAACITWLITAKLSKISSLSALCALAITPFIALIVYGITPALICMLISALVLYRHKDNIKRLLDGTEPRIGQESKAKQKQKPDEPDNKV
jgi:glycerol-3-phosphate acyltransferase PlsY